ncbi:hypothetical protein IWZ03DRAFT_358415 [Phyllosticta citriasiana]|uniref:Uncharacterized protein n=1 Tax=Phyllosticta citriasiana TaxID=595635 RepID=A0ABR1KS08_9PEZI
MRALPQVSTLFAAAGYFFCLLGSRGASAAPITGAKSVSPPWWDDASDHQGPQTIQKRKDPRLDAERDGKGRVQQAFLWRTTQRPRDTQMQPFSHHIKREGAAEPLAEEQEENDDDELAKITLSLVGEFTDAEEKAIADLPEDKQESKALETIDQKAEAAISKFTDGEKNAILAELPDETEKGLFMKEFPQFSTASKEIAPGQRLNPKARAMRDIIVQLKKDDGHVIEHDGKHALQKRGLGSFRSPFRGRVRNWFRGPKSQRWRSRCRRFCNSAKRKLSPKGGWHLVNEPTKVWYVKTDDSPYWGHLKDVEIEQDRLRGQDIQFRHTNPKGAEGSKETDKAELSTKDQFNKGLHVKKGRDSKERSKKVDKAELRKDQFNKSPNNVKEGHLLKMAKVMQRILDTMRKTSRGGVKG